ARLQLGLEGHRIDRAPAGAVGDAGHVRDAAGLCGGMTLATFAWCRPKSVISVRVAASTEVTAPPLDSGTHSSRPGYSSAQAAWKSRCLENASLASRIISFDLGFFVLR